MAGSNEAGIPRRNESASKWIISLCSSSSVEPTASFAAILAMGNPVALDASADERETRGFISMTTMRPSRGFTANCTFDPPDFNANLAQYGARGIAHALVFLIGQRLRRCYGNRIAGMNAHRVQIFD